jgi:hypothetical protein
MRSTKRVDLDSLVATFEQWRRDRRFRAIPDDTVGCSDRLARRPLCDRHLPRSRAESLPVQSGAS